MYRADSVVVSVILQGGGGGPVMIIIMKPLSVCECDYNGNYSIEIVQNSYNWH